MLPYGALIKVREFRARREYLHALRLENVLLRKPLSDLRAGYANLGEIPRMGRQKKNRHLT